MDSRMLESRFLIETGIPVPLQVSSGVDWNSKHRTVGLAERGLIEVFGVSDGI